MNSVDVHQALNFSDQYQGKTSYPNVRYSLVFAQLSLSSSLH